MTRLGGLLETERRATLRKRSTHTRRAIRRLRRARARRAAGGEQWWEGSRPELAQAPSRGGTLEVSTGASTRTCRSSTPSTVCYPTWFDPLLVEQPWAGAEPRPRRPRADLPWSGRAPRRSFAPGASDRHERWPEWLEAAHRCVEVRPLPEPTQAWTPRSARPPHAAESDDGDRSPAPARRLPPVRVLRRRRGGRDARRVAEGMRERLAVWVYAAALAAMFGASALYHRFPWRSAARAPLGAPRRPRDDLRLHRGHVHPVPLLAVRADAAGRRASSPCGAGRRSGSCSISSGSTRRVGCGARVPGSGLGRRDRRSRSSSRGHRRGVLVAVGGASTRSARSPTRRPGRTRSRPGSASTRSSTCSSWRRGCDAVRRGLPGRPGLVPAPFSAVAPCLASARQSA